MTPMNEPAPIPEDGELLERLLTQGDRVSRVTVDEVLRRGERFAPRLVAIIDDLPLWSEDGPRGWSVVHATFLLASMKPPGAFEILRRALDRALEFHDEIILESAPSLLASFADDTLEPLRSYFRDPSGSVPLRQAAGVALVGLAQQRAPLRDAIGAELRAAATDAAGTEDFRLSCAACLLDLADPQDRTLLLSLGDNEYFDAEYVSEIYDDGAPAVTEPLEDWMAFYDPDRLDAEDDGGDPPTPGASDFADVDPDEILKSDPAADVIEASTLDPNLPPLPFRREVAKVGRNDPCPCGSEAKFKKCCGR
jgi:hypothetical protein